MDFNTGMRPGGRTRRPGGGGFDYTDPLRSFLSTLGRVLFSPRAFFRDISESRGFANPLIFAATCILIGAVIGGVFNKLAQAVPGMRLLATRTGLLSGAISGFVYGLVGLVVLAGVYHLLVRLLVGANNAGFEGTFRVVCYALAVQVLSWLPLLNILVGIYGLYLCAFGFQAVHHTTYQRAAAIAALPILLLIPAALLVGFLAASLLSSV